MSAISGVGTRGIDEATGSTPTDKGPVGPVHPDQVHLDHAHLDQGAGAQGAAAQVADGRAQNAQASDAPMAARLFRWVGRFFYVWTLIGMVVFGVYIVLRGTGSTEKNFVQWQDLVSGVPLHTASDWIANIGIGMHYFMGVVLVLAWPILLSPRIRARHRVVHRWTGRVYVTAGLLAGIGGLSYILTHGATYTASSIAFGIWGALIVLSSVLAFVYARARRFDIHRAWAIRLFALVLGSWIFDIEYRAWEDFTGGWGIGDDKAPGIFDHIIFYGFFVPNLLVAEFFIRNKHKQLGQRGSKWLTLGAVAIAGVVFAYAIIAINATRTGKFGQHLLGVAGI